MMFRLVILCLSFSCFRVIENRICLGERGRFCCEGFAMNHANGRCEKCPIGYYRDNCSEKCNPPTYGEECQYICGCPNDECHFVFGCFQHVVTVTANRNLSSTTDVTAERTTFSSTLITSDIPVIKITDSYSFSADKSKFSSTTLNYLPPNIDIFDNVFVLVIICLIGIFVLFFAMFVITYIYKCFRKTNYAGGRKENEWQAHYKSLSLDAVEAEGTVHLEPQELDNSDCTYLTPVFICHKSSSETRHLDENNGPENNESLQDPQPQGQHILEETQNQNKRNASQQNVHEHVYIEIT